MYRLPTSNETGKVRQFHLANNLINQIISYKARHVLALWFKYQVHKVTEAMGR